MVGILNNFDVRKGILLLLTIIQLSGSLYALNEDKKSIETIKVKESPKIDGVLNDLAWKNAPVAKDFYQYEPYNGIKPSQRTEVKMVYDDRAIYIGATMYDTSPDSILRELSHRDAFDGANADLFAVIFSPFNDGVNASQFLVSASGVQSDAKIIGDDDDENWDAVWESKVKLTEFGWVVEMKIPYSALRFPKNDNQVWGIHFWRNIRRYREWDTWNFVDINIQGKINQMGDLSGIKNIEPPLRLSVTPYVSAYLENDGENNSWGNDFNAGMDLKWGINRSFTLDMILIPDFGQVQSDDEILNLSPYERRYDEKRQFFTEGTELFDKGGIFYSRRIGNRPKNSDTVEDQLLENEEVKENPAETQLINATKISGRTDKGLGIGFINAMTGAVEAEIADTITGQIRKYQTQGFTNYNMIVLDQSLKNNSYVSFANTNVLHAEENYTANVTGGEFSLNNKENSYQLRGSGAVSQKYTDSTDLGHKYFLMFAKTKGNFLFEFSHNTESNTYDPNDMGFIQQNNESTWYAEFDYNINKPFWKVLNWQHEINFWYQNLYKPRKYSDFQIAYRTSTTFAKRYLHVGFYADVKPFGRHDYFEPRVEGWQFNRHQMFFGQTWISTDYRKMFALDLRVNSWKAFNYDQYGYGFNLSPRVRFSDKWLFIYNLGISTSYNSYGYIEDYEQEQMDGTNETIINFGMRDQHTITNTINTNYIFNNKMSLSLRARHYWSRVEYEDFYQLQKDGDLGPSLGYNIYGSDEDYNYNAFTIDMKYLWRFAPGSEMAVVWKNAIYTGETQLINNFWDNLNNTLESSQVNSISLKILYYLDYQYLKKHK